MELKAVAIMTLADVFFVLYLTRQCKTILPLLTVATIIYTVSYVVPFYLQFDESTYGEIFDTSYAFKAVWSYYLFKFPLNTIYYLKCRHVDFQQQLTPASLPHSASHYSTLFYLLVMAFMVQMISINDIEQIIRPVDRFFSDNPILTNSMTVLILILFSIFYVLYALSEQKNRLMLVFALGICLFYPVLISSRSVVLPFVIMASILLVISRKYLLSAMNLGCSVLFYLAAISGRTELGIGTFASKLVSAVPMLGDLFSFLLMSISGMATLSTTVSGLDSGIIDVRPDPLLFLQYLSPIPSFFLSERIFEYTSLSPYLGIDPSVLGINADFISESLLWLSWYGPPTVGVALGYVFASVELAFRNQGRHIVFMSLFLIASLYFIALSNVAALRASSRLLVYSYLLYVAYNYVRTRADQHRQALPEN